MKIKINTVAIKNFNEDELEKLIFWANKLKYWYNIYRSNANGRNRYSRYLQFVPLDKIYKDLNKKFNFIKLKKILVAQLLYYTSPKLSIKIRFYNTSFK